MTERRDTGFKITDRRKFNPDGSPRDGADEESLPGPSEPQTAGAPAGNVASFPSEAQKTSESGAPSRETNVSREAKVEASASSEASAAKSAAHQQAERAYDQQRGPNPVDMPEASFVGLINMLAVEAELALGLIAGPGEEADVNLDAARHLIDMLGMLKTKTQGNLNAQEQNLLDEILAYLRMQFVKVSTGR